MKNANRKPSPQPKNVSARVMPIASTRKRTLVGLKNAGISLMISFHRQKIFALTRNAHRPISASDRLAMKVMMT